MFAHAHSAYLETQVATAPPQKLRLMLIEGAIRFARQTQEHWLKRDFEAALESLIRCREIVSELIAGVNADASPLARRVCGIYIFLFSTLTEAQLTRDANQLASAIRILEEERETWRQICEQLPDGPAAAAPTQPREELAPAIVPSQSLFSIDA